MTTTSGTPRPEIRAALGIVLCLVVLATGSCVTSKKDLLYLNDQIVALNERVTRLQNTMDAREAKISGELDGKLEGKLGPLREKDAQMGAEMDRIRTEIQSLTGRVEENGYLTKRAVERDTTQQDALKAGVADLQKRTAEADGRLKQLYEYLGLDPAADLRTQIQAKGETQKKAEPTGPGAPEPEKAASPEMEAYNQNLAEYKAGHYEKAISGFKDFMKKHPNSDLMDNAQYWIGEAHMGLKQYEQAILAFQEVIKNYPKGNKVPNAMLRQAIAFQELNDQISAGLLYKKILKEFPDSPEAKIAKSKLDAMK
jgi:tol-pal system protein YbgF